MSSSSNLPDELNELVALLRSFQGVGARSARRMAFAVLKWPEGKRRRFGELVASLDERVSWCPECGNIASSGSKCHFCADSARRDVSVVCVVEEFQQIEGIEDSGLFRGLYHVLGGRLAPLEGKGPESLNLDALVSRISRGVVSEVILALGEDVEGRATAAYVAEELSGFNVSVTKLARGLPAGGDIAYADSATIAAALDGRVSLSEGG